MKRIRGLCVMAAVLLAVVAALRLSRRSPATKAAEAFDRAEAQTQRIETAALSNATQKPQTAQTSLAASIPPDILSELNRFVVVVRPYGLDQPVRVEDITDVKKEAGLFRCETKTHLFEFLTKGRAVPKLHYFLATYDMSNPVGDVDTKREARRQWYQATAQWSEKEALDETLRILERLGIRAVWEKQEPRADSITVKNPQGESVRVTPFYTVNLEGPQGTISAEFRMGQSGPGHLTLWSDHTINPDAQF